MQDYDAKDYRVDLELAEREIDRQAVMFSKEIANLKIKIEGLRDLLAQQAARADELMVENARLREALKRSRSLASTAACAEVSAAESMEPDTDVFGAVGIAKKSLVANAKRAWKEYDDCIDAAISTPPGEGLEKVRREAREEAIKGLPCYRYDDGGEPRCDMAMPETLCPRCRTLYDLRQGGK